MGPEDKGAYGPHDLVIDPQGNITTYGDFWMPDGSGGYQRPANWQAVEWLLADE